MFETIVALATPPFKSAIALIRLSGDDCFDVVSKCFSKDIRNITKRTLLHGKIINNNKVIDDVMLAIYKGPNSFTGEDSVEIMCHGSMLIANEIISILINNGARMATNGEFSSRAFIHNKIDLIQAESINDVINATTHEAKDLSLMSLKGDVSKDILQLKNSLADLLSLIEVNIDFPEYEDIEVANKDNVIELVNKLSPIIENMIADGNKAKIIKDGVSIAIVGKPNVGKSSLLNAFLGEEKAIVTNIAGTTRDIVEGEINLNGLPIHLLDTAGIRNSSDVVENIGVNKAKDSINKADLVIVVLESNNELNKEDKEILELTKNLNRLVVYNKADLIDKFDKDKIYISSQGKHIDIEPLKKKIYEKFGLEDINFKKPALNNARQIGLLARCLSSLIKAKEDAVKGLPIDLVAISLRDGYDAILEILGETNQVDFSKEIFSRFCVGK